jgi:hypothetical protein
MSVPFIFSVSLWLHEFINMIKDNDRRQNMSWTEHWSGSGKFRRRSRKGSRLTASPAPHLATWSSPAHASSRNLQPFAFCAACDAARTAWGEEHGATSENRSTGWHPMEERGSRQGPRPGTDDDERGTRQLPWPSTGGVERGTRHPGGNRDQALTATICSSVVLRHAELLLLAATIFSIAWWRTMADHAQSNAIVA